MMWWKRKWEIKRLTRLKERRGEKKIKGISTLAGNSFHTLSIFFSSIKEPSVFLLTQEILEISNLTLF